MTAIFRPRWFEDYAEGLVLEVGEQAVDEAEVLSFARRYDPQPFHTDPEAAARSIFGGLITSGFHTCALMMRMLADHYLAPESSLGSPGLDELRWLLPVRPGDRLSLRLTVLEARSSRSKPDRGLIRTGVAVLNQTGAEAMTLIVTTMALKRPA